MLISNFFDEYDSKMTNSNRVKIIGDRLKLLREKAGQSQKDICSIIGIAPQTYNGYEKGKHEPNIETLIKLSYLYQVSMDYITCRNYGLYDEQQEEVNNEEYLDNIVANDRFEQLQIEIHQLKKLIKDIEDKQNKSNK